MAVGTVQNCLYLATFQTSLENHPRTKTVLTTSAHYAKLDTIPKRLKFKLQGEYGEGYENYMADPSPDVALATNPGNVSMPAKGKALPGWGFLSFIEYGWTEKIRSSMGYSMIGIQNADLQSPDAFRKGQYALFNLRYYPAANIQLGIEYQYGKRDNYKDGFYSNGNKIQCSFKVNFSNKTEIK